MRISTQAPDPSWEISIRGRSAVLWIGPSWHAALGGDKSRLASILSFPWAAVYIDANSVPIVDLEALDDLPEGLRIRVFSEDAGAETLPPNRLPIYVLRGPKGSVGPGCVSDPLGLLHRLSMLQRMQSDRLVFAIGVNQESDFRGLEEAVKVSTSFARFVIVGGSGQAVPTLDTTTTVLVNWVTSLIDFYAYLGAVRTRVDRGQTEILVLTSSGRASFDLAPSVDQSYPISATFEWIPAGEILQDSVPDETSLRQYLNDPSSSWVPYAQGVPYPRTHTYEPSLRKLLATCRKEGAAASSTAWLPAEDGSGATTVLRQLCFSLAREGYPVLLARQDAKNFDFRQLSTFLRAAAGHKEPDGTSISELPWIIAFDASHVLLHGDFVFTVANKLKALLRPVIILAIRPISTVGSSESFRALGNNHLLGPNLRNTVDSQDALQVGKHFAKLIPGLPKRSDSEWYRFVSDTVRTEYDGARSLFWLALRFWLLSFEGKDSSIRNWLATKFSAAVNQSNGAAAGILEVAAMAKYRLPTPAILLEPEAEAAMKSITGDPTNVFGVRVIQQGQRGAFNFVHGMIAEELLRLAMRQTQTLQLIGLTQCANLLDLELFLLGRLLERKAAGATECISVIEDLVVSGLRVDRREAPRNFEVRDHIVAMLERVPDALWDQSPIFNHHLARARRVLAMNPPNSQWDFAARREQLEYAENHILDAFDHLRIVPSERQESTLALEVTRAITCVARAALEREAGNEALAAKYEDLAEKSYLVAQHVDADNTHLLENFARFKIRRASNLAHGSERTRMLVEAISLLEIEERVDEFGERNEPITLELAKAYDSLTEGGGRQFLESIAATSPDVALTALARITLHSGPESESERPAIAEATLRRIPPELTTWRSQLLLYHVVSRRRPHAFPERLEILDELTADEEFAWPQQLRLEHAILMMQLGRRKEGRDLFKIIRDELPTRSAAVAVPPEMRFLTDPATDFREPLQTSILVTNTSSMGRNYYGIPDGWVNIDVPFRPWIFGREHIKIRDDLDCLIQFSNFGPQAVPPTAE